VIFAKDIYLSICLSAMIQYFLSPSNSSDILVFWH